METIKTYIQNLFQNYPDTPEVQKAREELTSIMEDKYFELKSEGKTENEAIGIVISEFGNMNELAEELGLNSVSLEKTTAKPSKLSNRFVSLEDAKEYLSAQKQSGTRIAIGVVLCILSVFPSGILDALENNGTINEMLSNALSSGLLFLFLAIAVALFIGSGMHIQKYETWKKQQIQLDDNTKHYINDLYESYLPKFTIHIIIGVVLCILSVMPSAIFGSIYNTPSNEWISDIASTFIFPIVAIGVYHFIVAGTTKSAYELLLNKGEFSIQRKKEKEANKIGLVAAIYWPIMTIIYLLWSFMGNAWHISWLIWPIAGITFGALAAILSAASKNAVKR